MTVEIDTSRVSYTGAGTTGPFTIPFYFLANADIRAIKVTIADGTEDELTLTTDFTLTGAGDADGGELTLVASLSSSFRLVIFRDPEVLQEASYPRNDAFPSETHEEVVDRLTMIAQRNRDLLDRSLRQPDGDSTAIGTLPAAVTRASKYMAFDADGEPVATSGTESEAVISTFAETFLDDETDAEVRATIDAAESVVTTKGDVYVGGVAGAESRKAVGTDGYALQAQSGATDGLQYLPPQAGFALQNGYLDWSVASSILTVAVKTFAGTDPSATDPVYISFRSVTPGAGSLVVRKLTATTSITIPDTASLGTTNSVAFRLWAVAFDDGGTVRLALINCRSGTSIYPLAGWGIASATQDGTGSDSAHVFYSDGAAVTSKAYATLGFASWESGLATAGTWSAAPTRAQLFGLGMPLPGQSIQKHRNSTASASSGTTVLPADDTVPQSGEGVEFFTQAITPSSAANVLRIDSLMNLSNSATNNISAALFQDATAGALAASMVFQATASGDVLLVVHHEILAGTTSATTFKARAGGSAAGTQSINVRFGGVSNSYLAAEEVMA